MRAIDRFFSQFYDRNHQEKHRYGSGFKSPGVSRWDFVFLYAVCMLKILYETTTSYQKHLQISLFLYVVLWLYQGCSVYGI